jgi:hypothetical protein
MKGDSCRFPLIVLFARICEIISNKDVPSSSKTIFVKKILITLLSIWPSMQTYDYTFLSDIFKAAVLV